MQPYVNPNYFNPYMQQPMDRLAQLQAGQYQPAQNNQSILWVQGESGAKSYLVAPNTNILLMDSEDSRFYIKSTDSAGIPNLRTFEYKEVFQNAPGQQKAMAEGLDDKYVTRSEYNDLKGKYEELYGLLESATRPDTENKRKDGNNNGKSSI